VNLIGEHVDYCGYSVLPMAIQYDIVMAVKPINVPKLQLTNTDSSHSDFQCDIRSCRYVSTRSYNSGISLQKKYNLGMTVQIIINQSCSSQTQILVTVIFSVIYVPPGMSVQEIIQVYHYKKYIIWV